MKKTTRLIHVFQILALFLCLIISACRSSKPAYPTINSSPATSTITSNPDQSNPENTLQPAQKTVAEPEQKVNQGTTQTPKQTIKLRDENSQTFSDEEEDETPAKMKGSQTTKYKYRKGLKDKDHWFSGIFIGTGLALMLTALVLVILGSGPAGLLALIGGGLFLIGFVGAMVVLIED